MLQAAADQSKLSIGVDSNQNYLHPGSVLTSMMKRVDTAVYNSFMDVKNGTWKGGPQALGLKEDGVDYAVADRLLGPWSTAGGEAAHNVFMA